MQYQLITCVGVGLIQLPAEGMQNYLNQYNKNLQEPALQKYYSRTS